MNVVKSYKEIKFIKHIKEDNYCSKMVAREITIIKKPRDSPIKDVPISFPPLQNLHLDLMENKKKLKKNIPLIQVKKEPKPADNTAAKYSAELISGVAGAAAGAAAGVATAVVEKKAKKSKKEDFVEIEEEPEVEAAGDDELQDLQEDPEEKELEGDADEAEPDADAGEEEEGEEAAVEAETPAEDDPYANMSPEEREFAEKEEYIWRFKILKKQYKNRNIQDYNEHDDLKSMKQTYTRTLREIQLEDNCESYRTYLIGGFMLMEFVASNWMEIDLSGFTAHQMTLMTKYDRMLIELGEKSYNRWGANLPVEIRLIGFIILQAGIFYLGKIIAEKGGTSMIEIFKMFTGAPVASDAAKTENKGGDNGEPKKKMRGPSVKVEDLKKKIAEEN